MKKYSKSFEQSTMESGDHFKNGANPKSLKSREKLNSDLAYQMHK
jgi:hypothetical protein